MAPHHESPGSAAGAGAAAVGGLELPPPSLLEQPLEYILADHFRQRCLCAELQEIAGRCGSARDRADAIVSYLHHDLPRHHQDEDEDLFPALRLRAHPEDELQGILERLALDHRQTETQAGTIADALAAPPAVDPIAIDQETAELMRSFAATEHRHLAIENGIVLVIARKRLKPRDLRSISEAMKARRGLVG
jgi:hemerythrin-like domain-containing protein